MKPYNNKEKKSEQIERMFDNIAPTYDLLNHLLSMRVDALWRKKLVREVKKSSPKNILDVATGTGDLAFTLASKCLESNVIGVDLSSGMIEVAKSKAGASKVEFKVSNVEDMDFEDESFDVVTCAFGVRNFENLSKGVSSMARVLKKGGRIAILEFSMPTNKIFAAFYRFYFHKLLPCIGSLLSKDRKAYEYLPDSVEEFASPEEFSLLLQEIGFEDVRAVKMTFGIAYIYYGVKK